MRKTGTISTVLGIAAVLLWSVSDVIAQGCAMCGTVGPTNAAAAAAFNWSILFMVAMPYMLFISIGGWVVYKHHGHKLSGQREIASDTRSPY